MTDKLQFVFIELPKFRKTESELETMTDKWFFLLRNLPRLLDRPVALRDRIFLVSLTSWTSRVWISMTN